jgi:transposase
MVMPRREYSASFKHEAIELVQAGHGVETVAVQLGVPHGTLWNWVNRQRDPRPSGVTTPSGASLASEVIDPAAHRAALRRIAELERENEFLGKASAYFAQKVHP